MIAQEEGGTLVLYIRNIHHNPHQIVSLSCFKATIVLHLTVSKNIILSPLISHILYSALSVEIF